jgi:uncharacterized GH25 family protein
MIFGLQFSKAAKQRFFSLAILIFLSLAIEAHEFWLQPNRYKFKVGEEASIDFMVGESFTGEQWDLKKHKVELLELQNAVGKINLTDQVKSIKGFRLIKQLPSEGTQLFTMKSNAAYIELTADKFNEYLKEDGLDDILDDRKKMNLLDRPSKENYTRFTKLLLQAGEKTDDTYKKNVGFRVEIVPLSNPYTLKTGDYLQCLVLFEGKPLLHSLVKVWSRLNTTTFLQNIYTEKDGTIKFPISNKGAWMVSTVKMISNDLPTSQYHSLWASLVFGIE